MDFKQYPGFSATVGLLGLVCVAGVGFGAWQAYQLSQGKDALGKAESRLRSLKSAEVAPTAENVEIAKRNLAEMQAATEAIFKALEGEKSLYVDFTESGGALNSLLRGTSDRLAGALKGAEIRIAGNDFGFGFTRYVEKGEVANGELSAIATENQVIEKLVEMLVAAKLDGDSVILQSIQREPVEVPEEGVGARRRSRQQEGGDEYRPMPGESLRKNGVVDSLFFKIKFTTSTEVVRRFLGAIVQSGYPLVIREVSVSKPDEAVLAAPVGEADGFMGMPVAPGAGGSDFPDFALPGSTVDNSIPGASPAPAPAATAQEILKRNPGTFSISLEYLIPQKPVPAKSAEAPLNN